MSSNIYRSSQVRFGSSIDWNRPELSPHAQVLPDHSHQRDARHVDEPPGQGRGKVGVVDPAPDHVEEVDGDCEVQTLLPSPDEKPQTESAGKRVQDKRHHRELALRCCKTKNVIAENLI